MSWSDFFIGSGSQTAAEQQANLERQKADLAAKLQARQDAGTLTAQESQFYTPALDTTLESQNAAAAVGALEGSVELVTNPTQWASDVQTGAAIAGDAAGKAVGGTANWLTKTVGNLTGGFLKNLPWYLWLIPLGLLFWWLGGFEMLAGSTRNRLRKVELFK